ncbi:glycogen synthase GlgA [Mangrovimicrobium sediminis]|uniref:Glycogen synthase n=1 Tax=Mangrovimicrobium sediminis TaxID=2562682 RepID=A0A4Z0LW00_9GAMM|nr:glycogen synthase GlgA [Haliea sp. SAOS-164]TGD71502.1 glycogen synthase GlgA [Haliea sp. SAOS-164]
MADSGRVLFAASEVFPLIKTGGLADVAGSLPAVLREQGVDVRILMPAYGAVLERLGGAPEVARMQLPGGPVGILETRLPDSEVPVWLLDHPDFSQRGGNPYHDAQGHPWADNAQRFLLLSRLAAAVAAGDSPLDWRADVLHCHDWHTGPAIALARYYAHPPMTVFTIHNLAHLGLFDRATFDRLHLPQELWSIHAMEFYGNFCFMKGGLNYADWVTTVSPTYAHEICSAPGGMGMEGLLSQRRERLVGILNGIDTEVWNPATDAHLAAPYSAASLERKALNKQRLQEELGLPQRADLPLFGFVGRLAEQKGVDLLLPLLDELLATPAQLVVLGTGEARLEQALGELATRHPQAAALRLAYNEGLAHRIEAGADIFLMPSLFEPCGLNQMYSLRYGTLPLVRATGGLADTVTDASDANLAAGTATGFVFGTPDSDALRGAAQRALSLWAQPERWRAMQATAMAQDFSWERSAAQYLQLYGFAAAD